MLAELGAQRRPWEAQFELYALSPGDYWIDVLAAVSSQFENPHVSIRVAVCNPVSVAPALISLLRALVGATSGRLLDQQTRRAYRDIDAEAERELLEVFMQRRAEFRGWYGDFEAAISGDEVYPKLMELYPERFKLVPGVPVASQKKDK